MKQCFACTHVSWAIKTIKRSKREKVNPHNRAQNNNAIGRLAVADKYNDERETCIDKFQKANEPNYTSSCHFKLSNKKSLTDRHRTPVSDPLVDYQSESDFPFSCEMSTIIISFYFHFIGMSCHVTYVCL